MCVFKSTQTQDMVVASPQSAPRLARPVLQAGLASDFDFPSTSPNGQLPYYEPGQHKSDFLLTQIMMTQPFI